jgi:Papain-like cysteine protease AvrRpt2
MLEDTTGVPLPLKGGTWQASTNVEREEQLGRRWCWAACVAMVLKAFENPKGQCTIAKAVCSIPCTPHDGVMPGCDRGYKVADIKALWEDHDVSAQSHSGAVKWDVIEQELKPKKKEDEPSRPVELFLGIGDANSKDGHLVLIVGAEVTAGGRRTVSIADPVSTNFGFAPTDFDSLETELRYGKWNETWTNLFWKKGP